MRDCAIARLHDCTVFTFRSPTAPTMSTVDIAMKSGIVQASRIAVAVDELDLVHASSSKGEFDDADYVQVSKEDAPAMEILEFEVDDAGVDKHKQALDVFDRDSDDEFSSARNVT